LSLDTVDGIVRVGSVEEVDVTDNGIGKREIEIRPRIYLNGFPKSGLHLAVLMGRCLAHNAACDYAWASSFTETQWSAEWQPDYKIYPNLSRLQDNTWLKGHCGYKAEIEQYLYRHGVQKIFVYRDLRDVLVSQSYHVINDDELIYHPNKEAYRKMQSKEERMMACLTGVGPYSGLFERWDLYAPWLWVPWVHKVRFEDMIQHPEKTAQLFVQYVYKRMGQVHGVKFDFPEDVLDEAVRVVMEAMTHRESSLTFRKGNIGDWREEFTPKVKKEFKRRAGRWLIELGYEKDNDW
jgi:hypothetical protein